jgi:hypothetical protein
VEFDGLDADPERARNLLVGETVARELDDLALAARRGWACVHEGAVA